MIRLDRDEHVIFELRKHWFIFAAEITAIVIFAFIPLLAILIVNTLPVEIEVINGATGALVTAAYSAWLLVLWIISFVFWTDYYLDIWIISNKKLVDVEQRGLFSREVSILHLDKIQDVTSEVHGIVATFMNFGDIHVQTAGQQREFVIRGVPNPTEVRRKLNDALMRYKEINIEKTGKESYDALN